MNDKEVNRVSRYRYTVVKAHLVEFEEDLFNQKMTDILDKYDVIVGDFSGGQLRLKGFYYNERKNVPLELKCVTIPEYLAEYCVLRMSLLCIRESIHSNRIKRSDN